MKFPRASGILLHITSLPSPFRIGDFGPKAFEFVDFLVRAKQSYWQILPLGQTGYGNSPYGCYSAFAGNIYLISPEKLVNDGLLSEPSAVAGGLTSSSDRPDVTKDKFPPSATADSSDRRVDYGGAIDFKLPLFKKAFEAFRQTTDESLIDGFHKFCDENVFWLDDYSLFQALRLRNHYAAWTDWDDGLKFRRPDALEIARKELGDEVFAQKFYQFVFFKQWYELKEYANFKNVKIIGDIPIYLTTDSCDVWCNQDQFKLNGNGQPSVVAGVPPDAFSSTGQLWGSPIYDWDKMRNGGFKWWIERVRFNLAMFDIARIDHFIGFIRAWEVPGGDATAENGKWVSVPGHDLVLTLEYALGDLPLIAEDLGSVTREVEHLRDTFEIPGMRVLQFAFGGDVRNTHMPHNYIQNSVACTGTHDSDTVVGWYNARKRKKRGQPMDAALEHCLKYLGTGSKEIHWDFIKTAIASVADIAIIPMQDLLGLDNSARMNLPASMGENWVWRCRESDFSYEIADRLSELSGMFGRSL